MVDEGGMLVGVVSEADLVGRQVRGYWRSVLGLVADYVNNGDPEWVRQVGGLTAGELMTRDPDTVAPDDDLALAARHMLKHAHKRLAVVADGAVRRHRRRLPAGGRGRR